MPRKIKPASAGMTALPSIPKELIEQLAGSGLPMTAEQINGPEIPHRAGGLAMRLGSRDPLLRFPSAVRRVIYTTNAIESTH